MLPLAFLLAHLALVVMFIVLAAISGRRARTDLWRQNGQTYRRIDNRLLENFLQERSKQSHREQRKDEKAKGRRTKRFRVTD